MEHGGASGHPGLRHVFAGTLGDVLQAGQLWRRASGERRHCWLVACAGVPGAAVSPGPGVLFSGLDDAGSSGRAAHDDARPEQAASGTGKGGTGEAAEIAALI